MCVVPDISKTSWCQSFGAAAGGDSGERGCSRCEHVSGEVVEAGARAEGEQQACERHAEVVLRRGVEAPARAEEG